MIYNLLGFVAIMVIITILAFNRDMIAPAFLLNSAFLAATFCACLYADKWKFSSSKLIWVVLCGLSGFTLFSFIVYFLDCGWKKPVSFECNAIELSNVKLIVYIFVQLIIYVGTLWQIIQNVGSFSNLDNLSVKIALYYELVHNDEIKYSNFYIGLAQTINFSGIYFFIYCAICNIIYKGKKQFLTYLNIIIGIIGSLLTGTKTAFYMYSIGAFIMFVILMQRKRGWTIHINIKIINRIFILLIVLLLSFGIINSMQGRVLSEYEAKDVLATYLGSPIKNLEIFIEEHRQSNEIFGAQTFKYTYNDIYNITHNNKYLIKSMDDYHWINSYPLGNVYTFFRAPYYDFGMYGVFIISGIAGAFSQKMYDIVRYKKKKKLFDMSVLFYAYISFSVVFCFFSNKFFESVLSKSSVYFLIGCWLFELFFIKLKVEKNKIYLSKNGEKTK